MKSKGLSRREVLVGAATTALVAGCGVGETKDAAAPAAPAPAPPVAAPEAPQPYPPARTGWRGSHPGSFENMHRLGQQKMAFPLGTTAAQEQFDLVVVGAGVSGLTAAYAYRKVHATARVLILDNHDDFGGHARRNEFILPDGRKLLSYAGSESFQSPKALFSEEVNTLMAELGVDIDQLRARFDAQLYPKLNLGRGIFFNKESYGVDKCVVGDAYRQPADDLDADSMHERPIASFVADFPLPQADLDALLALHTERVDYLHRKEPARWKAVEGLKGSAREDERDARDAFTAKLPYDAFLRDYVGLSPLAISVFRQRSADFLAIGVDGVSTDYARTMGLPGTDFLGLSELSEEEQAERTEPYRYHFPDGNASVARLLVARLVPNVVKAPLKGMDDVVLADFDYTQLDIPSNDVRIRLSSTVCRVENPAGPVGVGYLDTAGELHRVDGAQVVLACYSMVIPYLFAEADLPAPQREALSKNVKAPLVYGRAVLRDWKAWQQLAAHEIYCPDMPYARVKLDYPVSMGGYKHPVTPDEPVVVHMVHVPLPAASRGQDARTQARAGRWELFAATHEARETALRDQLQRMLGGAGFDHQRDVLDVTINVWSHGYSYCLNSLYDEDGEDERVAEIAGAAIGRVVVANSDLTWAPYLHAAIDNALAAVKKLG